MVLAFVYHRTRQDQPRRGCLATLERLNLAIARRDAAGLLQALIIPESVAGRTPSEQAEFIQKALKDEISSEGIALLKKNAQFGPLKEIFPQEAEQWAAQAGVQSENCLAFRLDRLARPRMEVVIFTNEHQFRVIRCNNIVK